MLNLYESLIDSYITDIIDEYNLESSLIGRGI